MLARLFRTLLPRGRRPGLAGFAFVCALVVGGLGWATQAALRLEQEQAETRARAEQAEKSRLWQRDRERQLDSHRKEDEQRAAQAQAEFAARLRLALWRIDSRIAPFLAREENRPYSHYAALFAPSVVLDSSGTAYDEAQVLEPSPLLNAALPEWQLLHFQVTAEADWVSPWASPWASPQVPPEDKVQQLVKNNLPLVNVTRDRRRLLRELAEVGLVAQLFGQLRREELKQAGLHGAQLVDGLLHRIVSERNYKDNSKKGQPGYGTYSTNPQQGQQPEADPQGRQSSFWLLESSKTVLMNSANQGQVPPMKPPKGKSEHPVGGQEQVVIRISPMLPVWLPAADRGDRLAVVRLVEVMGRIPEEVLVLCSWPRPGLPASLATAAALQYRKMPYPREVGQGVLLDWPRLQALFAAEVADLFPQARFLPVRDEVPPHPERTLTALPVEMDPGPQPAVEPPASPPGEPEPVVAAAGVEGWTPLRIGLALAWAAALVALGAVGIGGRSLLALSERRIRFVSAVTHELRTPLTTLRLYLDMLTGGLITEEEKRNEYLHTLHAETDRLHRLVSNVLDFSRLENQRPRLEKTTVAVADLLQGVRDAWETRCQDCGKQLLVENGLAGDARVLTDLHLVQQILGNLIDNACKYSRGAEDARLWLRARAESGALVLEVEDRGPGVPARERQAIFRPFCRGSSVDVTAGGVGLGLALAQRWAELLGGTLTLQAAQAGTGARFSLKLPAAALPPLSPGGERGQSPAARND
jgi:signal transduction histidine kinase